MEIFTFNAAVEIINNVLLLRVPPEVSRSFPSRGMVMAEASVGEARFLAALEPDGSGSHWFELDESLGLIPSRQYPASLTLIGNWAPPTIPEDLHRTLAGASVLDFWNTLTVKAQWEWIRWIRATANPETRKKRMGVACSKLAAGDRRPCCFDASRCSVPQVSKGGVLLKM